MKRRRHVEDLVAVKKAKKETPLTKFLLLTQAESGNYIAGKPAFLEVASSRDVPYLV